jgi:hypothetical protein
MPNIGRELVRAVGGDMEPGEKLKGYIRRVAQTAGIGFRSVEAAWRDQYVSKNTANALRKAATHKAKNDDGVLIEKFEAWITAWEKLDPSYFGPDIAALRHAVDCMRRMADTRSRVDLFEGGGDDRKE